MNAVWALWWCSKWQKLPIFYASCSFIRTDECTFKATVERFELLRFSRLFCSLVATLFRHTKPPRLSSLIFSSRVHFSNSSSIFITKNVNIFWKLNKKMFFISINCSNYIAFLVFRALCWPRLNIYQYWSYFSQILFSYFNRPAVVFFDQSFMTFVFFLHSLWLRNRKQKTIPLIQLIFLLQKAKFSVIPNYVPPSCKLSSFSFDHVFFNTRRQRVTWGVRDCKGRKIVKIVKEGTK